MAKANTKPQNEDFYCKLRIDKRTVMYIRTEESFNNWLKKFPKAEKLELQLTE